MWREVKGFPGYEVSTSGEIRSYWKPGNHKQKLKAEPHMLAHTITRHGNHQVTIRDRVGSLRTVLIHRMMMQTFREEERGSYYHVHHLNGDHGDNRLSNLKWGNPCEYRRKNYVHPESSRA